MSESDVVGELRQVCPNASLKMEAGQSYVDLPSLKIWTVHTVLGRAWHTPSWRDVAPGRPVEMLLQHLKAYA